MANCITLYQAKLHLKIDATAEDDLIEIYIAAAHDRVRNYLNDEIPSPAPSAIKAAILLIVGDMYENREAASEKELFTNQAAKYLLDPYRTSLGL